MYASIWRGAAQNPAAEPRKPRVCGIDSHSSRRSVSERLAPATQREGSFALGYALGSRQARPATGLRELEDAHFAGPNRRLLGSPLPRIPQHQQERGFYYPFFLPDRLRLGRPLVRNEPPPFRCSSTVDYARRVALTPETTSKNRFFLSTYGARPAAKVYV